MVSNIRMNDGRSSDLRPASAVAGEQVELVQQLLRLRDGVHLALGLVLAAEVDDVVRDDTVLVLQTVAPGVLGQGRPVAGPRVLLRHVLHVMVPHGGPLAVVPKKYLLKCEM